MHLRKEKRRIFVCSKIHLGNVLKDGLGCQDPIMGDFAGRNEILALIVVTTLPMLFENQKKRKLLHIKALVSEKENETIIKMIQQQQNNTI